MGGEGRGGRKRLRDTHRVNILCQSVWEGCSLHKESVVFIGRLGEAHDV